MSEGEGAQDVGGPYREAVDNICAELHSEALPLLVRSPNGSQLNSLDRDRRILNPAATTARHLRMFEVMGALLGLCLRTRSPLPFELSGYVWQQLVGEQPTLLDLYRVDRDTVNLLLRVRHNNDPSCPNLSPDDFDAVYGCIAFVYHRSDGVVRPPTPRPPTPDPGSTPRPLQYALQLLNLRSCPCFAILAIARLRA